MRTEDHNGWPVLCDTVADYLSAAPSPSPAPGVVTLEWREAEHIDDHVAWCASSIIGEFVVGFDDGWYATLDDWKWEWCPDNDPRTYEGPSAGQKACQAYFEGRILSALAHPVQPGWRPTHRHVKRGSEYMLLGIGKMQTSNWMDEQWSHEPQSGNPPQRTLDPVDMSEVAVYRGEDGKLWVRPREEFEDGRFEALPAAPQPKGE
jgi:hypothetical protein